MLLEKFIMGRLTPGLSNIPKEVIEDLRVITKEIELLDSREEEDCFFTEWHKMEGFLNALKSAGFIHLDDYIVIRTRLPIYLYGRMLGE